ncbi:MAG: M24 family metallopeptidase [Actinobacteria bacterium]|nr:M24 family metallopeptidase [Actinomycetota bacterium]
MSQAHHDSTSRRARRQRLLELMERCGVGALLLRRSNNFAWYTNGADTRVDHASPFGVAAVLITPEAEYVLTNNIEAPRMREEQTPDFEVVEHPWHEDEATAIRELAGDAALGADFPLEDALDVSDEVSPLRYVLDPDALERYRRIGADAAAAVAEAADSLEPGMSELGAAANLAAACRRRRLFGSVLLAAADDRIVRYRHPIPHGATIERRAMLVVSAERGGLYANVTRIVHFEEPDKELRQRLEACETILRRMREEATRPGHTLADAFEDCRRFYAEEGFPEEWRLHHQGGMTGYASREVIATPETRQEIRVGQALAWNPSVTGAKAEETFVLTESGPEVITPVPGEVRP